MTDRPRDLDEGLFEYFDFKMKGHLYRFHHLTTEQMSELMKLEGKEDEALKFIGNLIVPLDPKAPTFAEIYKQMTLPLLSRFWNMIKTEFNPNGSN